MLLMLSLEDFIEAGCMAGIERAAAERAIEDERRFWLPLLEAMAAELATQDAPLEQRAIRPGLMPL